MCKEKEMEKADPQGDNCLNCTHLEPGFAKGVPTWHCRNNEKMEKLTVNRRSICKKHKSSC